jgi:hypothetical protein
MSTTHRLLCATCGKTLNLLSEAIDPTGPEVSKMAFEKYGWTSWQPTPGNLVWWFCKEGCRKFDVIPSKSLASVRV